MKRIEIRDLHKTFKDFDGKVITVCGWARTVRDSKNIAFIELNDGAFKSVQVVVERDKVSNYDEIVKEAKKEIKKANSESKEILSQLTVWNYPELNI